MPPFVSHYCSSPPYPQEDNLRELIEWRVPHSASNNMGPTKMRAGDIFVSCSDFQHLDVARSRENLIHGIILSNFGRELIRNREVNPIATINTRITWITVPVLSISPISGFGFGLSSEMETKIYVSHIVTSHVSLSVLMTPPMVGSDIRLLTEMIHAFGCRGASIVIIALNQSGVDKTIRGNWIWSRLQLSMCKDSSLAHGKPYKYIYAHSVFTLCT